MRQTGREKKRDTFPPWFFGTSVNDLRSRARVFMIRSVSRELVSVVFNEQT